MRISTIRTAGAAALAACVLASGASASIGKPAAVAGAATPAQVASAPTAAPAKRYCIKAEHTGSRMSQKICRTRAEWKARGVDVLESAR